MLICVVVKSHGCPFVLVLWSLSSSSFPLALLCATQSPLSFSLSMLLLDAFNKDRASLPQPLPNPPPLAPIPVAAPDPRTQEMINEKLKKAEDLGEQGKVDEAQKALEEAEVLKKCQLPTRQEPVVDNSILQNIQLLICELLIRSYVYVTYVEYF
ncbi:uncharacterized protein [Arachis hypogaea]|uniref:uncharacterized protein isoform X2 n=1 Tax=Arachis hypogaea TaxID=3818 RepID=UPI003B224EF3